MTQPLDLPQNTVHPGEELQANGLGLVTSLCRLLLPLGPSGSLGYVCSGDCYLRRARSSGRALNGNSGTSLLTFGAKALGARITA